MKKILSLCYVSLGLLLSLLVWDSPIRAATWSGGDISTAGTYDVAAGTSTLTASCTIDASAGDITLTAASDSTIATSGEFHIYLKTGGNTIKFITETGKTLSFKGHSANHLLVVASGSGIVEFDTQGGGSVTLERYASGSGYGTMLLVGMSSSGPTVRFTRPDSVATYNSDVNINVQTKSAISFLAPTLSDSTASATNAEAGTVEFNPNSTGTGRMILNIADDSCVEATGHYTADVTAAITTSDITWENICGYNAKISTSTGAATGYERAGLLVINQNNTERPMSADPYNYGDFTSGTYKGRRAGFIIGPNGELEIANYTYLDYVGTTGNVAPTNIGSYTTSQVKDINHSAFKTDGVYSDYALNPKISLAAHSGIYLRSAYGASGFENAWGTTYPFTVSSQLTGIGSIVFYTGFEVDVVGASGGAFNVISGEVYDTDGAMYVGSGETVFPLKTFSGREYARSCVMNNDRMNFFDTNIVHTDTNNTVQERDAIVNTTPTYIGGDQHKLFSSVDRPRIALYNTTMHINTSAAITGCDIVVPNYSTNVLSAKLGVQEANTSYLKFYYSGFARDLGQGRILGLGSTIGSLYSDGSTTCDQDAHVDVFQEFGDSNSYAINLYLTDGANDTSINSEISGTPTYKSVQHIYMGHASNVAIGTIGTSWTDRDGASFTLSSLCDLKIDGNFFAFEAQGGTTGNAYESAETGNGLIVVDQKGKIEIGSTYTAYMGVMIAQNGTSTYPSLVSLPKGQVVTKADYGHAAWQPAMDTETELVSATDNFENFTIKWDSVTFGSGWEPYGPHSHSGYVSSPVTSAHVTLLPEIKGKVDQLQFLHALFGFQPHVKITGSSAHVGEAVFIRGGEFSESSTAIFVLEDNGRVGIGSADIDANSSSAIAELGQHGITIIPNGITAEADGRCGVVELNKSTHVDSVGAFVAGPTFAGVCTVHSDEARELRISTVLDLSTFASGQTLELAGKVKLVFEPGAKLVLGGGTLRVTDDAQIVFERETDLGLISGSTVTSTDDVRVKLMGTGTIEFKENGSLFVENGAYVGVETDANYATATDITFSLTDSSQFQIGDAHKAGGAFQVGNTAGVTGHTVKSTFTINGYKATMQIGREGFFGIAAGIIDKSSSTVSSWTVGSLYNVDTTSDAATVTLTFTKGKFIHDRIIAGDGGSMFALGGGGSSSYPKYTFTKGSAMDVYGGGNVLQVAEAKASMSAGFTTTGVTDTDSYQGILGSKHSLDDGSKTALTAKTTAKLLYDYFIVDVYTTPYSKYAPISLGAEDEKYIGFVGSGGTITRQEIESVQGADAISEDALREGSALGFLNSSNTLIQVLPLN